MKYFNLLVLAFGLSFATGFSQQAGSRTLDAKAFHDKMTSAENAVILDVRTPGEYSKGFIKGARNLDYRNPDFKAEIDKLDKSKSYLVYCLSGARSAAAAQYMRDKGFKEVYDMKGGIMAWQQNNLPVVTPDGVPEDKISSVEYNKMISSGTVLVDFYAPWCAPCKKMEPWLNEIAKEYSDKVQVTRINIDENNQLVKQLGVAEIPVLKIFKNGKETWKHKGLVEKTEVLSNL